MSSRTEHLMIPKFKDASKHQADRSFTDDLSLDLTQLTA